LGRDPLRAPFSEDLQNLGGGGTDIEIQDDDVTLTSAASLLNFKGFTLNESNGQVEIQGGGSGGLQNVLDTTVEVDIENIDTLDFSRGTVVRPLLTDADFENELSTRTFETGDESNWTKISQGQGTTVTHTVTNTRPLNGSFSWEMEAQGSSSAPQQLITQTSFNYSSPSDPSVNSKLFVADKSVYVEENQSGEVASIISAFFENA